MCPSTNRQIANNSILTISHFLGKSMKEVLLLLVFASVVSCGYRERLNHFLHDFEELAKEHVFLEHATNFTVLSAMKFYMRIELKSQIFHALLQPHASLFHPELVIKHKYKDGERFGSINVDEYFEGSLVDEPHSRVLLHIKDNLVTGSIQVSDQEKYFIEPSGKHIKEPHDFHMIAYKLSDVKFNFTRPDTDGGHFCGHESHDGESGYSDKDFEFMIPKSSVNEKDGIEYSRRKRDAEKKTRCPLALVADYKFYKDLHDGDEGAAIKYMIGLIQQIDPLFKRQSLDPSGSEDFKDYGFSVKYIEVIMEPEVNDDPDSYKNLADSRQVSALLKNFAFGDWRPDYCLAHLFTNYDFDGGVLGLAYVASASQSRVGGICTKTYSVGGAKKSLNVGLTTGTNYGRTLLQSELVFVTGHEFGHNWGSSHDSDTSKECAPSGDRFLMYPAAVDGSQPNNYYFSPCSKMAINEVLRSKADICFTKANEAVCGNGLVEDGEECDQGLETSPCCRACQLTTGSQCEPINDRCCGDKGGEFQCQFHENKVCIETDWEGTHNIHCSKDWTCRMNSTSAKYECMAGDPLGTDEEIARGEIDVCFDNGRCRNGECKKYCEFYGKVPCMCTNSTNVCKQCCKDDDTAACEPFSNTGDIINLPNGKICGNGNCEDGVCKISAQDFQEKFWDVIDRLDVNMVLKWFRNNIVFTIIIFTSLFWIPISLFVNWLDDKYDLGFMDDLLGSSDKERKKEEEGRLIQESTAL
ncbi:hypothetical protein ACHWQZ_G011105 [Mnemiopsis leidyi]